MAAASRLLGAAAACVMLLPFATGQCKSSYWSGCIKLAIMFCHVLPAAFLNVGAGDFPF